jgi:membrane protease YdiL (CAAX protease family)
VSGYLRALLIAMSVPFLQQLFMGLAGYLQLRDVSASWGEAMRAAASAPLNLALVQAASIGLIFILAFPHRAKSEGFLDAVNVRPLSGGIAALCFAAGLMLQLPFAELGNLAQEIWPVSFDELAARQRLVNPTSWWGGVTALLGLVIVAPVTEELLFRGWLMRDLAERYGPRAGLLWSSILFGLVHLEPTAVLYATVAGVVLGAVALKTGSTLASIAMHAGVNALPLLVPRTLVRIEGFNTLAQHVEHIRPWLVMVSLLGAVAALTIVWRSMPPESEPGSIDD